MNITKFGHCCILVEENNVKILIDPSTYSDQQNTEKDIDYVLITHEHADHLSIESLKSILNNNPKAKIITNKGVGELLKKETISFKVVEDGQTFDASGVLIEGFGKDHATMHKLIPLIRNVGYFIENKLFYPGDALIYPNKPVEILALPVTAPWMRLSEAIDYAIKINPKTCFAMHEGILKKPGPEYALPQRILPQKGIEFTTLEIGKRYKY